MSNPILIIRIPYNDNINKKTQIINQLMDIQKRINDYHIFPIMESNIENVNFEVLNVNDSNDITLEELKNKIINIFKNE